MDATPPSPPPAPPQSVPSSSLLRHLIILDTDLSLRLYTLTQPILPYSLLKSLEISGDGGFLFPVILSLLSNKSAIFLLLGSLLDLLCIGLLKHLIRRPRPVYNKNMFLSFAVDHWSFSSGHSSRVSFIAALFYFYSKWVRNFLTMSELNHFVVDYFVAIVAMWAVITSLSRVLLGRHFVFDVLAGMCLGVLEGLFVFRFFNYDKLISFFR